MLYMVQMMDIATKEGWLIRGLVEAGLMRLIGGRDQRPKIAIFSMLELWVLVMDTLIRSRENFMYGSG